PADTVAVPISIPHSDQAKLPSLETNAATNWRTGLDGTLTVQVMKYRLEEPDEALRSVSPIAAAVEPLPAPTRAVVEVMRFPVPALSKVVMRPHPAVVTRFPSLKDSPKGLIPRPAKIPSSGLAN